MVSLGRQGACSLPPTSITLCAADGSPWLRTGPRMGGRAGKRDSLFLGMTRTDREPWLILEEIPENKVTGINWHTWLLVGGVSSYELLPLTLRHWAHRASAPSSLPPKAGHVFIKRMDSPSDWVSSEERKETGVSFPLGDEPAISVEVCEQ